MTKNTVPNDLQAAVDLINRYLRDPKKDPALLKIEHCSDCGKAYPTLPEDAAIHEPRCRECAPAHKRKLAANRAKVARIKKKQQATQRTP